MCILYTFNALYYAKHDKLFRIEHLVNNYRHKKKKNSFYDFVLEEESKFSHFSPKLKLCKGYFLKKGKKCVANVFKVEMQSGVGAFCSQLTVDWTV